MQAKWVEIRQNLEKMLDPGIFRIWVAPLSAEVKGLGLEIIAPNLFMLEWVKKHLQEQIQAAAAKVLPGLEIAYRLGEQEKKPVACSAELVNKVLGSSAEQAPLPFRQPSLAKVSHWHFNFEDFVTGPSNNFAVAAARDLAQCGQVRTLFVNSKSGLGKTHLCQATGQAITGQGAIKIAYMTAEQFASRFVTAMRTKDLEGLKQHLCSLDALLLEDVHFLARKKAMQEMILGVIKNLQAKGARIIFTSSFAPRQLQDIDEQLVSHFCSGMLTSLEKPDLSMRREILERKAKFYQVKLPDEVCDVLARRLSSDIRQLEACLKNMIFKARLLNSGITVEMAMETASQYADSATTLDVAAIISMVCESFGLTEQQLRSKSRRQDFVNGRNTAFYLARKHTDMSLEEIGCIFNRRHSTVMRGITQVEQEIARESRQGRQFARAVAMIERRYGISM